MTIARACRPPTQAACRRLAGRWWFAQHPPSLIVVGLRCGQRAMDRHRPATRRQPRFSSRQFRGGEDHVEGNAVDHQGQFPGDLVAGRNLVVLGADVPLEGPEIDIAGRLEVVTAS